MPNYVVLRHRAIYGHTLPRGNGTHFDWMFDHGRALWTWATDEWPDATDGTTIRAIRLADHRRAYLTIEGELSEQRGEVSRVESGQFAILRADEDCYEFDVAGGRSGIISFQRTRSRLAGVGDENVWNWSFRRMRVEAS